MKKHLVGYIVLGLLLFAGAPAGPTAATGLAAQANASGSDWFSGLKLRGHHLFQDYHSIRTDGETGEGGKNGYGAGIEIILPSGLSFGASGFTAGRVSHFNVETTHVVVTGDLNFFLPIRTLSLAPFAGVHSGIVAWEAGEMGEFGWHDATGSLGYQYGVRFQPMRLIGVDAQVRHLSGFARDAQIPGMGDTQFLLGITLF